MLIDQIVYDVSAIARLAGAARESVAGCVSGLLLNFSFDRAPRSKDVAAIFASDRGVVGVLVGHVDDGPQTFKALKSNCDVA